MSQNSISTNAAGKAHRSRRSVADVLRSIHSLRHWVLAWLFGATLLYFVSWPAHLYRLSDEAVRAASSDGTYLATQRLKEDDPSIGIGAPRERDAQLLIRKASSGRLYRSIATDSVSISSVEFANDKKYIVAQCDDRVVTWDVSSGKQVMSVSQATFHSVAKGSVNSPWAAVLLHDESFSFNSLWNARYNGVKFVEIASGKTVSTLQPFDLHKGPWDVPGLVVAPTEHRAVTISRVPEDQRGQESTLQYTVWDTQSGKKVGEFEDLGEAALRDEGVYPRAWTISPDSKELWLAFGYYDALSGRGSAYLHVWDLESLQLKKRIADETTNDVIMGLGNAHRISFLSDQLLVADTTSGDFLLKLSNDLISCVAIDGHGNVISPDGSIWAKEAGEIVDAAPPFVYQISDRRLSVVQTGDGAEVATVAGPTGEVTSQSLFDPLGFTPDNRYLVYEQYLDSFWGQVRATLSDLVNFRIPKINYRPIELRCLDMRTGRSRLVGMPERAPHLGEMLPGDRLRRGYEVWAVPGRKPWLVILLLPLLPLLVVHRWRKSRDRRLGMSNPAPASEKVN